MKFLIIIILSLVLGTGCAGMNPQQQQNMTANAGLWGLIGAATGAGIAAATGGKPGKAAVLGGIGGAYLGAANTPPPGVRYRSHYYHERDCGAFLTRSEEDACEEGRSHRLKAIQMERERRAYQYGYYSY